MLRIEQPGSSLMFAVPEMRDLLALLGATRLWTWQKPFGHPIPKPTVLQSNIPAKILERLRRKWSKQIQASIRRGARLQNSCTTWLQRRLGSRRRPCFPTAYKFWKNRKAELQKIVYTFKTWASSGEVHVTGGKQLAESAAYSRGFAREILATFTAAANDPGISISRLSYQTLWRQISFPSAALKPLVRNLEEASI